MSITKESELEAMRKISDIVAITLKEMRNYVRPGMSAKQLDEYGGRILCDFGARSAPKLTYNFPGWTCISINHEIAHGIPGPKKIFREGDLINIDVSAEHKGFWSDNGGSFVLGNDHYNHQKLIDTSRNILFQVIQKLKTGVKISEIGRFIQSSAYKAGFRVIKNLAGHGVGRSLHEEPHEILNYYDPHNHKTFKLNAVVAIETFVSTKSIYANQLNDGWTLVGNKGGYTAQHEHTVVVTNDAPRILTLKNGIWD
jgi:methionyl aminopeptidase